jgi:hypothetical protein
MRNCLSSRTVVNTSSSALSRLACQAVASGTSPPSPKWASARQPSLPAGLPSRSSEGAKAGGARRDRTDDLMLAKHALSQLSYGPKPENEVIGSPAFASAGLPSRSKRAQSAFAQVGFGATAFASYWLAEP